MVLSVRSSAFLLWLASCWRASNWPIRLLGFTSELAKNGEQQNCVVVNIWLCFKCQICWNYLNLSLSVAWYSRQCFYVRRSAEYVYHIQQIDVCSRLQYYSHGVCWRWMQHIKQNREIRLLKAIRNITNDLLKVDNYVDTFQTLCSAAAQFSSLIHN